ncbi:hypothetical protein [Streptomyces sp. NPDC054804]
MTEAEGEHAATGDGGGVAQGCAGAEGEEVSEVFGVAAGGAGFVEQAVVAQGAGGQAGAEVEIDPAVADVPAGRPTAEVDEQVGVGRGERGG